MDYRDEPVQMAEENMPSDLQPAEGEVIAEPVSHHEDFEVTMPPAKKRKSWLALIIIILLFTAPFALLILLDDVSTSDEDPVLEITIQDIGEIRELEALEDIQDFDQHRAT